MMRPLRILLGCVLASLCLLSGGAWAQVITEFSDGITALARPYVITAGPDGNLWFTEVNGNRIGRITPLGVVTEFSAGIGAFPFGITAGPDGNLWFAESGSNQIGRITPQGVVTKFGAGISRGANPEYITAGPDGNLWFTEWTNNRIGRITPLGVVTEFSVGITPYAYPYGITAGPDGNLWFTEYGGNRIGRITPQGVVTEFSAGITAGAGLSRITAGPDGNLWFTEQDGNRIGRITPQGVVTEFSTGLSAGASPRGITAGPDGNLWFTEVNGNRIGRITPLGVITEFSAGLSAFAGPIGITAGPDGNLWFTEGDGNRIGRITTGTGPAAQPCVGFVDVDASSAPCPSVEWIKNRKITLGCLAPPGQPPGSYYCPDDAVTRSQMAAFIQRLGKALTAEVIPDHVTLAAMTIPGEAPTPPLILCEGTNSTVVAYPRKALLRAAVTGLSDGHPVAWRAFWLYSLDGGVTFQAIEDAGQNISSPRTSSVANQWSGVALAYSLDVPANTPLAIKVGVRRDNVLTGTTGNFANVNCQMTVSIVNANGSTSPL